MTPRLATTLREPLLCRGAISRLRKGEPMLMQEALQWDLFNTIPHLGEVPIVPMTPDLSRWRTAAVQAKLSEGRLDNRSRILINPNIANKTRLLKSLKHETCHLLQLLTGTWKGENLTFKEGHANHPLELEAKWFSQPADERPQWEKKWGWQHHTSEEKIKRDVLADVRRPTHSQKRIPDMRSKKDQRRLERTKLRHKKAAAECHRRLTELTRRKIAWVIQHFPEEAIALGQTTLQFSLRGQPDPEHLQWKKLLQRGPKAILACLLSQRKALQELNSCHPFGHALKIYEQHHPKGDHPRN